MLDQADEVVLVDLTTDALLNRLRRGVVYDVEKIPEAPGQLLQARESRGPTRTRLRKTAEEVDEFLERITAGEEALHPWAAEERIVVCIRPSPVAAKLIRRGHRLAKRFQGRLWVLHVRTHAQIGGAGKRQVEQLFELARELGGEVAEVEGDSVARRSSGSPATIVRPTSCSASPGGQRVDEIVRGTRIAQVIREIDHADVLVVADTSKSPPVPETTESRRHGHLRRLDLHILYACAPALNGVLMPPRKGRFRACSPG